MSLRTKRYGTVLGGARFNRRLEDVALKLGASAAYRCLGGASTTEPDFIGGKDATWNTAPATTTALVANEDTSADLTAGTKWALASNTLYQAALSAVTVVGFYKTSTTLTYQEIGTCSDTAAANFKWLLRVNSGNHIEWIVNATGGLSTIAGTGTVTDGAVHMAVGTYNSATTTQNLYNDLALVATASPSGSIPSIGAGSVVLGGRTDGAEPMKGVLGPQFIFTRALSLTEIAKLYVAATDTSA